MYDVTGRFIGGTPEAARLEAASTAQAEASVADLDADLLKGDDTAVGAPGPDELAVPAPADPVKEPKPAVKGKK